MKALMLVPTVLAAMAASRPALDRVVVEPTWQIDSVHSSVLFRVQHVGAANFWGCFKTVAGTFSLDRAHAEESRIEVRIDAASIDTRDEGRDKHLRGPDFFDSKQFPEIRFQSTTVKALPEGQDAEAFEVVGELELRGKKKQVTVRVTKTGEGEMRGRRVGYETEFKILRSEFGMDYGVAKKALGDEVAVVVAVEGIEAKKQ